MKILFTDNSLWSQLNFRGYIITHLRYLGHEVVMVSPADANSEGMGLPDGVRHIDIAMRRTSTNPIRDLCYFFRLLRIYRKERPDYIFHFTIKPNIYGTLAARLLGIHSTAMVAGLGFTFSHGGWASWVAHRLFRLGLSFADKIMVLNEENARILVDRKVARKEQVVLLEGGEGVDLERFRFSDNRSDKTIFLMVARVLYDKGYREVVEAAKIVRRTHPEVEVQLLGPVDEAYPNAVSREQIRKDEESGAIKYLGYTTEPEKFMGRPGILLLLSSYHEGLNRSLMEGCALGKPIIASDIPGCRETVCEGENGYLVPPKDSDALAKAMLRYLSLRDEEKEAMSVNSRRLAEERFDINRVKGVYVRILQDKGHLRKNKRRDLEK
ncbi:glycosyltransferase family 4 protein [Parabacteroides sp.]|uniref:glycosyltransferase family 4 protein n=1 Tax=Parabacteroides sp. TaxID=1869337 RepID=UPI00257BEC44|nr:glycosyltransferase family 4 protein [Parabacteroides sp.]